MSCALIAREKQEDPAGTAVHIKRWICLEIPQGWLPKFKIHDLNIPQEVKEAIQKGLDVPQSRLQLIRGNRSNRTNYIAFVCDETGLYTCQVENLQEWSHYDWTDFSSFSKCDQALTLICTHGSRDACCGTMGGKTIQGSHRQSKKRTPNPYDMANISFGWDTDLHPPSYNSHNLLFLLLLKLKIFWVKNPLLNPPYKSGVVVSFYTPAAQFADIHLRKK